MDGRSALLTLWGEKAEQPTIALGQTCIIRCIKASKDFRGQRSYNSTPSTTFEVNNLYYQLFWFSSYHVLACNSFMNGIISLGHKVKSPFSEMYEDELVLRFIKWNLRILKDYIEIPATYVCW